MSDYTFRQYVNAVATVYARLHLVSSWAVLTVHPGPDRCCFDAPEPPVGVPGSDVKGAIRTMKACLRLWWGTRAKLLVKMRGGRMVPLARVLRRTRTKPRPVPSTDPPPVLTDTQLEILRVLKEAGRILKAAGIASRAGKSNTSYFREALKGLVDAGLVQAHPGHFYGLPPSDK